MAGILGKTVMLAWVGRRITKFFGDGPLNHTAIATLIGGAIVLLATLCFAELGAALPQAGGEYVYLGRGLGPKWGFLFGWTSALLQGPTAAAWTAAHSGRRRRTRQPPRCRRTELAISATLTEQNARG